MDARASNHLLSWVLTKWNSYFCLWLFIGLEYTKTIYRTWYLSRWTTRIVLPLKAEISETQKTTLTARFREVHPSLLLFLHRLRSITIIDKVIDQLERSLYFPFGFLPDLLQSFLAAFFHVIRFSDLVGLWVIKIKNLWCFAHVVRRDHVNRAWNTNEARTWKLFFFCCQNSKIMIMIATHGRYILWELHEVRKGLWAIYLYCAFRMLIRWRGKLQSHARYSTSQSLNSELLEHSHLNSELLEHSHLNSELLEHSHLNSELLGSIKHRHLPFLLFIRLLLVLYFAKVSVSLCKSISQMNFTFHTCSSDVLFVCCLFVCFLLFAFCFLLLFVCCFLCFWPGLYIWQVNNKCEEMTRTDLGNKVMEVSHSRGTDRWLVVKKELDASKVNVIHYFLPHHRSQRIQQ